MLEGVEADGGPAPSGVLGPVLLRALRRFASDFLVLVMSQFLPFVMDDIEQIVPEAVSLPSGETVRASGRRIAAGQRRPSEGRARP